jgi:hypothetical protein
VCDTFQPASITSFGRLESRCHHPLRDDGLAQAWWMDLTPVVLEDRFRPVLSAAVA